MGLAARSSCLGPRHPSAGVQNQGEKEQLLGQWRQHWKLYVNAVEELRQERQNLEGKHLDVEARLVERGLQ